ncbi:origin recognition complex subunit 1 [Culex quinquefasciatus]|uniref:origin recognition complex subunit 1 n=1 Tax=Culex quinquefasciatus TaxID=7176 RepID=UPI0018E382DE|nr:origin recognition complex subunit 1 [Culex quinquefasciatus]
MKKKINNNDSKSAISWVGEQYQPNIERTFRTKTAIFYRKCHFGALTLEVGSYVLVSNTDSAEPDSVSGCDVARIEHMYDLMFEDPDIDSHRAIVQWYSRPGALPKKIVADENYTFDFDKEIVEDYRYNPDISIESIFRLCKVEIVDPKAIASEVAAKISTKFPLFIARYRLTHAPGSKKMFIQALKSSGEGETTPPRKRKSMADKTNRSAAKSATKDVEKTPKLRLTRAKSIEFVDMAHLDDDEARVVQKIQSEDNWVVKVVEGGSYQKKLDNVTEGISEVELSDEENVSPSKMARINSTRRKSGAFRRNLNASLHCESPTSSDTEHLNYSIVKDEARNTPQMKIKLRLSEVQKPAADTPTRRSARKRSTAEEIVPLDIQTSPPKARKSIMVEEEPPMTPTSRPRRKSILKTPSTKNVEAVGTPKRNIQLSNIVEEFAEGRRTSKVMHETPKKATVEEPKTPKSARGRPRKSTSTIVEEYKSTPKSATKLKLIRSGAIKPNVQARDAPVQISPDDQLAVARERLHVSAVPKSLPCREKEYSEIYNFLEGKIIDSCGGCMYVSGVPGTGKTATTTAVIRSLQVLAQEEEIPTFEFVEINGMRLTEPRQAYVHIYRQLTGKTLAWEQAYNLLDKRFTTKAPRRVTTVLLVDELDILCNRRQDVVYNLLNWPTVPSAQLVVITIANTMDLPERLLMGKISSRLGLTRLTFQPYNFRQLQEIVMARLTGTSAFDAEAVQLVARKVAAVSGDARRALDICRRATELAEEQSRKVDKFVSVSMGHVQKALGEMIASAKVQTIKCCSRMEQLFLQAVTAEVARTGIEECSFLGVYSQFEALAAFAGVTVPNPGRAIAICSRLGASRLLICENSRNDIYQKILLNISSDDVHYALQASNLI